MDTVKLSIGGIKIKDGNTYKDVAGFYSGSVASNLFVNLPKTIYAVVGKETNIYFDNIVPTHDTDYEFTVTVTDNAGMQLDRCWRYTPTSSDVGKVRTINIKVSDIYGNTVSKSANLVTSGNTAKTVSVMVLGDSTTANNNAAIIKRLKSVNSNLTSLGTLGESPYNHEGRAGWGFSDYFSTTKGNHPFYNNGFDASHYFASRTKPDWFIINLGINDMLYCIDDASAFSKISSVLTYANRMVTSLVSAGVSKIGIALTIPPSYTQDPWGKSGASLTRARYKRNNALLVKAMLEYNWNSSVSLIPIYAALDTEYNMGMEDYYVNAYNTSTYSSIISDGNVHPAESGYAQIADAYHAFILGCGR